MEAIVACCAGLDVHQASVVVCLNRGGGKRGKEIRSFGTTRGELTEMCAWLKAAGCTLVAMESTGIYWHPVYFALEGQFELIVGNPSSGIPAATRPEPWPASPSTSRTCRAARPT
jgi:transposase